MHAFTGKLNLKFEIIYTEPGKIENAYTKIEQKQLPTKNTIQIKDGALS